MADPLKTYRTASGKSVLQTLTEFGNRAEVSLGRALYQEGTGIMEQSRPLVPVDTSALRSSGYVAEPYREGDQIVVDIGYGGPAARINEKTGESTDSYALYVHENLEAFHPVGTAKFLEMPFDQAQRGMGTRIARQMRSEMAWGQEGSAAAGGFGEPEA